MQLKISSHQIASCIQVQSGKFKKDKDGNWEFEYDTPKGSDDSSEEHSEAENATIQPGQSNDRPSVSGMGQDGQPMGDMSQTLNLVKNIFS
jgi:hypothetical protein